MIEPKIFKCHIYVRIVCENKSSLLLAQIIVMSISFAYDWDV